MIKIICVGKLKESFFKEACDEYLKRLKKYTNIQLVEITDSSIDNEQIALEKEKDLILSKINEKDYIITMDIDGVELNSLEFSKKINEIFFVNSNITFIIGGSHGVHNDIKKISQYRLSFSKLTFPHQLFRVLLLEQIYRSFKILNNERYHK